MLNDALVVNSIICGSGILGFLWSVRSYFKVAGRPIDGHKGDLAKQDSNAEKSTDDIVKDMKHISKVIQEGAYSFLFAEYWYMAVYIALFSVVLMVFMPNAVGVITTVSFIVGAVTSIVAGFIGMYIAVFTNVRTAHECWKSLERGFDVAIQGGCVMGLSLVALGVLNLFVLIEIIKLFAGEEMPFVGGSYKYGSQMYEAIAGYGLGGSSIALFGRVGGGIYTKAADVGADLSGKNEYGLEEDDYRNPACIADNVGDNVGDIAGMGADLFGSFAEATCAAMVIAASSEDLVDNWGSMMFPMLISSVGIVAGVLTLIVCGLFYPVKAMEDVEKALKGILVISTVIMTPVAVGLSYVCLPEQFKLNDDFLKVQWWYCAVSICLGLWSGLIIGFITEYYTSHSYTPVREIAETQKQSAATGIIYGLALGYLSCIVPVICLAITILVSHTLCGMLGVALGALGMLGTMTMGLTIDAYGPISDNAGGIAEMSGLPDEVRTLTDCLDAAGNTTAAIGKGFAIGSAALVSLALFGAFCVRAEVTNVNILNAWTFTGLLLGAMMPYAFAAWTMKSVGEAANEMVKECMRQFPQIMNGTAEPDYESCISISTQSSLKEMLAPGALVILSPLIAGIGFGKNCCAGLLSGALVSSVQLAISMSNTGGAWDNSKKYISAGGLGPEFRKGSDAHKNSVTGDTVGDPLKDTSGPALNIVMKLTAIISLVFGTVIAHYSNADGGPFWL
jgi:inorganic pyrophosphatase